MSPPTRTIIVFGDLVYHFHQDLRELLHIKNNVNLADFFSRTALAFRREFASLPHREQHLLPKFTTLVDLLENAEKAKAAPAVRFALLCLYQIGRFINHFGKDAAVYPTSETTYVLGLCTGSFAAAAISTSQSIVELIPAGVEAVVRAFRTALRSYRLQQDLDISSSPKSWSAVVSLEEQPALDLIDQFMADSQILRRYRPFISAVSPSHVTISGPPTVLQSLLSSTTARSHLLPIETPYHASHLYTVGDVDEELHRNISENLRSYKLRIPIISPVSGALIQEGNFESLLHQATHDTLREQVRWDTIGAACQDLITHDVYEAWSVLPCASNAASFLSSSLSSNRTKNVSINDVLNTTVNKDQSEPASGRFSESKIAVVGFSGRFPDAASNDELWELLQAGKDTHRTIPKDRFDWEAHYDASGAKKNTSRVKYGCFVDEPGSFDARFFHMSPREAEDADPAQRLALMTTYEALEMAGFVADRTPSSQRDRVGVFFGSTSDDWREVNSGQNVGTYFIPGGNRAFIPGRITFFFRFSGPSISVDTACSSSFAALHTACQSLWQGGCDTAIAGGTNILTNPDNFAGLDKGHFLSTTGNCNPFDDDASGYCRADAVASLVLKRLEDAEADNDPILGVIAGVNTNHCGQTVSITRPHEGDQLSLFRRILRDTNTNPIDVSYVEMHGTGTQAGDATEMSSVLAAMVPGRDRTPNYPLHLGAVKANIGHAESASGVTALIKVLMMMQHDEIPPHIGIKNKINRNYPLDLAERNVHIAMKSTPWRASDYPGKKRVSFLNNFSAAGGNTAVLLEDAPKQRHSDAEHDARPLHPVVISANSTKSLKANVNAAIQYLRKNPDTSLSALSYTTTARRIHHKFRVSCVASDLRSVEAIFEERLFVIDALSAIPLAGRRPRVAFTFTGQGTLYAGLGKQLFETVSSFRTDMLQFDRIARQHGFSSFLPLIESGPELIVDEVDTVVAHIALICLQMALHRLWISWGIVPDLTIGHSLGEYPALFSAGVLSASDTIYLVGTRAQLLSHYCSKGSHSMLAVKAPLASIERTVAASSCDIACTNSPMNTVISGARTEIDRVMELLRAQGLECIPLSIPYAFHSAQVDSWIDQFEAAANRVRYQPPTVPYISPLLKRTISANEVGVLNGAYLSRACRGTVSFLEALEAARDADIVNEHTHWLEIGSHPACSTFIKRTMGSKSITIPSLRQARDPWETIVPALQTFHLSGFDIDWNEYHRDFSNTYPVLSLPSYGWDLKNYWIQYQGNFCLTKGDAPVVKQELVEAQPAPYISSSIHRIIEEHHESEGSTLLTESDVRDPRLFPILQGHKVNGVTLCPSSLYADMAFTAVRYILRAAQISEDDVGLNCAEMKVDRPLIATTDLSSQMLRLSATANWSRNEVSLVFFSIDSKSNKEVNHATCLVKITHTPASNWLQEWKRIGYLVQGRISSLQKGVHDGQSHKLRRGLAYRLFGSLVDYADDYQGMQEVTLDTEEFEATAQVVFQTDDNGFDWNPCWIDSLGHIAGFIMNGSDHMYSKDHIFLNHGWGAMRCAKKIEHNKTYQAYNKMHPEDEKGNMFLGDTYILEDGMIVAIFEGVKFQRVPRSVLDRLLPPKAQLHPAVVRQPIVRQPVLRQPVVLQQPNKASIQPKQDHNSLLAVRTVPVEDSFIAKLKAIICQESGIDLSELDLRTPLADYGIDSLLSLTITSRLQEDAGIKLSSSAFVDFATLGELIEHLAPSGNRTTATSRSSTPALEEDEKDGAETEATSVTSEEPDVMETVCAIIASEAGVSREELTPTADLSEFGLDSLLSLNIIGRLSDVGIHIPTKLLIDSRNLHEVALGLSQKEALAKSQASAMDAAGPPNGGVNGSRYHATSVRLQGSSGTHSKALFLFPDGAGSATSYLALPSLAHDIAVYGLNCPWLKTPQDLRCNLQQYVSKFVVEIRRRQSTGPYYFGGWSAGGILAYEAAQQLARAGEAVEKLILFDTPDPVGINSPPQRMYDFLESLDMFGMNGRKAPSWLRPHFTAFITMLDQYCPVAFAGTKTPATLLIYARDGLCKNPSDPRPEERPDDSREMKWLLNNRTDFEGGSWRMLVGAESLTIAVVDNANHYSLMNKPDSASKVAMIVADYIVG